MREHREDPGARAHQALRDAQTSIRAILKTTERPSSISNTRCIAFVLGMFAAIFVGRHYGLDAAPWHIKIAACYLGGHIGMAPYR